MPIAHHVAGEGGPLSFSQSGFVLALELPQLLPVEPQRIPEEQERGRLVCLDLLVHHRRRALNLFAGEAVLRVAEAGPPIRPADIMPMPPIMLIAIAPVCGKRSDATASMVGQKNVLPTA